MTLEDIGALALAIVASLVVAFVLGLYTHILVILFRIGWGLVK